MGMVVAFQWSLAVVCAQARNKARTRSIMHGRNRAESGMMKTSAPCLAALPDGNCMEHLTAEALAQVAAYFQALSEPARLRLLNLLRSGRRSVGELAEDTGYSPANVSRHLALLAQHGMLAREAQGTSVYYSIADPAVYELCNLVCGNLGRRFERTASHREAFAAPTQRAKAAKGR